MRKTLLILIIVGILLVATSVVTAAASDCPAGAICIENPLQYNDIKDIIGAVADLIAVIGSSIAVIMIIWGGIQYMTAGGDESKAANARKTITWAIIGVAIVWSAKFITDIIQQTLKVKQ